MHHNLNSIAPDLSPSNHVVIWLVSKRIRAKAFFKTAKMNCHRNFKNYLCRLKDFPEQYLFL